MNYTSYKDIPDFYNVVRTALGIDEDVVTNSTIDMTIYAPMAEHDIKNTLSNWETISDDKQWLFENCIIIKTALILYPSIASVASGIKALQIPSLKTEFNTPKNDTKETLEAKLDTFLESLIENRTTAIKFIIT